MITNIVYNNLNDTIFIERAQYEEVYGALLL